MKLLILALALHASLRAEIIKTEAQALQELFPQAQAVVPLSLSYTAQLKARLKAALGRTPSDKAPRLLRAQDAQGKPLGLAVVDDEMGKHQPISYLVALDAQGRILGLEMLVFRESQGDGVRSRRFRSQFKGKALGDPLELGKDLDAVSGATISSRTLAYGARKSLWLAREAGSAQPLSQAASAEPNKKEREGRKQ